MPQAPGHAKRCSDMVYTGTDNSSSPKFITTRLENCVTASPGGEGWKNNIDKCIFPLLLQEKITAEQPRRV